MFSFPSEERERERERPRNVRAGIRLSQLFLPYTYVCLFHFSFWRDVHSLFFGESFFSFFFGESCTCTEFRVDKKGPNASIAVHFPVFSLDFVWIFQVIFKSSKETWRAGFIGSDLNEEVPNHPANERTVKHPDTPPDLSLSVSLLLLFSSSSYFHSFSKKNKKRITSTWTSSVFQHHRIFLYRFLFRFLLHLTSFRSPKKKKKEKEKIQIKTSDVFSFHDPWTVIGAWTAIGDGPVIVDHCVVK